MMKLEDIGKWGRHSVAKYGAARTFIDRDEALAAAKLDNEAAYRQGVEDAIRATLDMFRQLASDPEAAVLAEKEIRQRLERLKGTDNG